MFAYIKSFFASKHVKSALISAAGAAAAYVAAVLSSGGLNLGVWGPLVAAVAAWAVNALKVQMGK